MTGAPDPAEVPRMAAGALETHMSVLFFYGDRVLKVRKPVGYGFADFRDAEERRADCRREVELNRRLAPDVYLGTATVVVDGRVVEHAVVMRRLAASRNLAAMIGAREDVDTELTRVAEVLARFHAGAARSPAIDASASPEALWQRWQATEEGLGRFVGTVVDADDYRSLTVAAQRFLRGWGGLFDRRVAEGAVCDGHGDLQATDIFCLPDGPRLLDCLEFDDQLRHGDVLADVAFLVQDLERMGARPEARHFTEAYRAASATPLPEPLLHFYVAARAHVRLLVECLRREQRLDGLAADPAAVLAQARHHLEMAIPRLVLVGGLPGTGKSTLATWVAGELGAKLLSSDEVRVGLHPLAAGPAHLDAGPYQPEARLAVYDELADRATGLLRDGHSVVLDATWSTDAFRRRARAAARAASATLVELECRCSPEERNRRISSRVHVQPGDSEATIEVAEGLAAAWEPWSGAYQVDTDGGIDTSRKGVLDAVRAGAPLEGLDRQR